MGLGGRRLGFIWRWGRGGGCGNLGVGIARFSNPWTTDRIVFLLD